LRENDGCGLCLNSEGHLKLTSCQGREKQLSRLKEGSGGAAKGKKAGGIGTDHAALVDRPVSNKTI